MSVVEGELSDDDHASLEKLIWPEDADADTLKGIQGVWFSEYFKWSLEPNLHCFFEQDQNGPCGVLSGVQALVLQNLLFSPPKIPIDPFTATLEQRNVAFAQVLTEALWRAGNQMGATLLITTPRVPPVISQDETSPSANFRAEYAITKLRFANEANALQCIADQLDQFLRPGGIILFLYSLVLSRGFEDVNKELEVSPDVQTLVYNDGCCEQGIVNFVLSGRCCNEVDADYWPQAMFRVGFLTVEEQFHPAYCFVTPAFPVWVAHGGGHYTVLWTREDSVLQTPILPNLPSLAEIPMPNLEDIPSLENDLPPLPSGPYATPRHNPSPIITEDGNDTVSVGTLSPHSPNAIPDAITTNNTTTTNTNNNNTVADGRNLADVDVDADADEALNAVKALAPRRIDNTVADSDAGASLSHDLVGDNDDEDEELARALAMSLENDDDKREASGSQERTPKRLKHTIDDVRSSSPRFTSEVPMLPSINTSEDDDIARAIAASLQDMSSSSSTTNTTTHTPPPTVATSPPILPRPPSLNALANVATSAVLSLEEQQIQQAMAESMKDFVCHNPNSTTTNSTDTHASNTTTNEEYQSSTVLFYHYNGLHPPNADGKPLRVCTMNVDLHGLSATTMLDTPEEKANAAYCIATILERRPLLGGTKQSGPWEYHVVCYAHGSLENPDTVANMNMIMYDDNSNNNDMNNNNDDVNNNNSNSTSSNIDIIDNNNINNTDDHDDVSSNNDYNNNNNNNNNGGDNDGDAVTSPHHDNNMSSQHNATTTTYNNSNTNHNSSSNTNNTSSSNNDNSCNDQSNNNNDNNNRSMDTDIDNKTYTDMSPSNNNTGTPSTYKTNNTNNIDDNNDNIDNNNNNINNDNITNNNNNINIVTIGSNSNNPTSPFHAPSSPYNSTSTMKVVDGIDKTHTRQRTGKWRCRNCHLQEPPNWKAIMEEDLTTCTECEKHMSECGVCHWISQSQLPESLRRDFDRQRAPPVIQLLRRRWGEADVRDVVEPLPSLWG